MESPMLAIRGVGLSGSHVLPMNLLWHCHNTRI